MTENKGVPEQLPLKPVYKVETQEEREDRLRDDQGFYGGKGKELPPLEPSSSRPLNLPSSDEQFRQYFERSHDPVIQRDRDKRGSRKNRRVKR